MWDRRVGASSSKPMYSVPLIRRGYLCADVLDQEEATFQPFVGHESREKTIRSPSTCLPSGQALGALGAARRQLAGQMVVPIGHVELLISVAVSPRGAPFVGPDGAWNHRWTLILGETGSVQVRFRAPHRPASERELHLQLEAMRLLLRQGIAAVQPGATAATARDEAEARRLRAARRLLSRSNAALSGSTRVSARLRPERAYVR
jgi:hypothetical protein